MAPAVSAEGSKAPPNSENGDDQFEPGMEVVDVEGIDPVEEQNEGNDHSACTDLPNCWSRTPAMLQCLRRHHFV